MSRKRNKVLAWLVLFMFGLVIFGSTVFIVIHADHECTSEDCSVCMELAECHKTLNAFGTDVAGTVRITVMLIAIAFIIKEIIVDRSYHTTLISLKVELLN